MEEQAIDPPPSFAVRIFGIALAASLILSAALYFVWSRHWPLVGDASLMHYIVFLSERGWSPYRDFGDMNMPGAYLVEMAAMQLFGMGALAWRLFDFTLLAAATAAIFSIVGNPGGPSFAASSQRVGSRAPRKLPAPRLAALFASSLFILVHGRDGIAQGGQRDLTIAVCLIAATALLLKCLARAGRVAAFQGLQAGGFGLFSGIALTIKPTSALLTLAQLLLAAHLLRRSSSSNPQGIPSRPHPRYSRTYAAAVAGYAIAPAICLVFLLREHAFPAFLSTLRTIVPYYASLGHRPLGYIVLHSLSPVLSLVILWLVLLVLDRPPLFSPGIVAVRAFLLLGVVFGLVNCVLQARALPYYRYPLLAFLLPLMAIDFTRALRPYQRAGFRPQIARLVALAAVVVGGFFLAPQSAILIHRDRWWETDFNTSLQDHLEALGGAALSRHIQCIDTNSGCGNVLYLMRLEPSTGLLSDFLLFGVRPGSDDQPAVRDSRAQFTRELVANPPQVIVVTSHLYLGNLEDYRKLDLWPALAGYLGTQYVLQTEWTPTRTERWWSREELPAGYRIYVLRPPVHSGNP